MNVKDNYIKDLFSDLKYSASKFDTQTLIISGGALGFSLTFITDIVPFTDSIYIWLLYLALSLFIFSITMGFFGHYKSLLQISKTINLVMIEKYEDIKPDKWIPKINLSIVISVSLGVLSLVLYCAINIGNQRGISQSKQVNQSIEITKKTDGGFIKIEGELKTFNFQDTDTNTTEIKLQSHE